METLGGSCLRYVITKPLTKGKRKHLNHTNYYRSWYDRRGPLTIVGGPLQGSLDTIVPTEPSNPSSTIVAKRFKRGSEAAKAVHLSRSQRSAIALAEDHCVSQRSTPGKIPPQKRGEYFRVLRDERRILAILANITPPLGQGRWYRRTLRLVYYRTLPILLSRLSYWKDKIRLAKIERFYYDLLNTVNLNRGNPRSVSRLPWLLRCYSIPERVSLSKQSSIEPSLEGIFATKPRHVVGPFQDRRNPEGITMHASANTKHW